MTAEINLFPSITNPNVDESLNTTVLNFLNLVRTGKWQDAVLKYRQSGDPEHKKALPSVTLSGTFRGKRENKNLRTHSGFICVDIDKLEPEIITQAKELLSADENVYAIFRSCSDKGLAVVFKIDPAKHAESHYSIGRYLHERYSLTIDESCKNVARVRYVSFDPELYLNINARTFRKLVQPEKLHKEYKVFNPIKTTTTDFQRIIDQLAQVPDLLDKYDTWYRAGFAIASEYKHEGLKYFLQLSATSSKHHEDQAIKKYYSLCEAERGGVKINFIYWLAKENNIPLYSPEVIEQITKAKALSQLPENPTEIEKQVFAEVNTGQAASEFLKNELKKDYRYNTFSHRIECKGEPMDERDINSFITAFQDKYGRKDFPTNYIHQVLASKGCIPEYNPMIDWIEEYKHLQPTVTHYEQLINCFKFESNNDQTLAESILRKFIIGIIASILGDHCVIMPVLSGPQGAKKTIFWRELMPEPFRKYISQYSENHDKDFKLILCSSIMNLNDEFRGASKLIRSTKEILSSDRFFLRAPYGKTYDWYLRKAVLCGCTNDPQILFDHTGNRRIIPINIISIDITAFRQIDKNQLFMWAYHQYKNDPECFYLNQSDLNMLTEFGKKNESTSIEEDAFLKCLFPCDYPNLSNLEILDELQKRFPTVKMNPHALGKVLFKHGFQSRQVKKDGKNVKLYPVTFIQNEAQDAPY